MIAPQLGGQYPLRMGRADAASASGGGERSSGGNAGRSPTGQVEYYHFTGPTARLADLCARATSITDRTRRWGSGVAPPSVAITRRARPAMPPACRRLSTPRCMGSFPRISRPYSREQEFLRDFDDARSYDDRSYGAIDVSWSHLVSSRVSFLARTYADLSHEYEQVRSSTFLGCLSSQPNGCIRTSNGGALWFGTELQTTIKWLSDLSMSTMLGVEARVRRVHFGSGIDDLATAVPVASFGYYEMMGASGASYAQQVYTPLPSVTLNAGARWDLGYQFGQRISPRLAADVNVLHGERPRSPTRRHSAPRPSRSFI